MRIVVVVELLDTKNNLDVVPVASLLETVIMTPNSVELIS